MGGVDGPGVRCVVFMQGCPLRCAYCHNPDTWDFSGGEEISASEMAEKILRYRGYIMKNGGVTVTGGEPLMQGDFVAELFRILHEHGIHTALDTSCFGDIKDAEKVLSQTDLVLADLKFMSGKEYEKYCGADIYDRVTEFFELTKARNIPVWLRRVVVPEINDTEDDMRLLSDFVSGYENIEKIELLPFRKLCLEKYDAMGIDFPLRGTPEASGEIIKKLSAYLPKELL